MINNFKPILKRWIKKTFDSIGSLFIQPLHNLQRNREFSQRVFASKTEHVFCGYYDICPFDQNENLLLAIHVDAPLASPQKGTTASVGYYRLADDNPEFIKIGQTQSWNWQQGCRLRWQPPFDAQNVVYNVMFQDHYGAFVQNIVSGDILKKIDYPLYDIDTSGSYGLSLNFSRLGRLRPGYGYTNLPDTTILDLVPKEDGIWLIDTAQNQRRLIISLAEIAAIEPHESMRNAQHYFNHLSFNPSGTSFLFFHLWVDEKGKKYSRLFTSSTQEDRITLLNNIGMVSHYTWFMDDHIVITTINDQGKLRYFQYHQTDGFEKIIGDDLLTADGHPTFLKDGKYLITDTYPDKYRNQKLLFYSLDRNKINVMDRVFSPYIFSGEVRCDLHPRPSPSNDLICIDVPKNNRRAVKVIDISRLGKTR